VIVAAAVRLSDETVLQSSIRLGPGVSDCAQYHDLVRDAVEIAVKARGDSECVGTFTVSDSEDFVEVLERELA